MEPALDKLAVIIVTALTVVVFLLWVNVVRSDWKRVAEGALTVSGIVFVLGALPFLGDR